MKRLLLLLAVVMTVMVAVGCETKEKTGTLAGGAAGAVLGRELGGTTGMLLGAVGGAFLGREVGQRMDEDDRKEVAQTLEQQQTGETRVWTNPDTGERYSVTPTETFEREGRPCRRFDMDIAGEAENVEGTACRTASGDWQIVG